jgi:hypothetical protein
MSKYAFQSQFPTGPGACCWLRAVGSGELVDVHAYGHARSRARQKCTERSLLYGTDTRGSRQTAGNTESLLPGGFLLTAATSYRLLAVRLENE